MEGEVLGQEYEVELRMFGGGQIRRVKVEMEPVSDNVEEMLFLIFQMGQNDINPMNLPSVSAGDVIRYQGDRYLVQNVGFRKLAEGEYTKKLETLPDILAAVMETLK